MKLGERLQQVRKERGYSQERVAEVLHVTRQAISKWETGAASPDIENLTALADLYGLSLDELVRGGGEAPFLGPEEEKQQKQLQEGRHLVQIVWAAIALSLAAYLLADLYVEWNGRQAFRILLWAALDLCFLWFAPPVWGGIMAGMGPLILICLALSGADIPLRVVVLILVHMALGIALVASSDVRAHWNRDRREKL